MKKLIKNKFFIFAIIVMILSIIYLFAQKAIDNYFFNNNSDILVEEDSSKDIKGEGDDKLSKETSSQILDDEIDLTIEEFDTIENDDNIEKSEEINGTNEVVKIEEKKIYVYITGEVNKPGVVILNEGDRIVDAIDAAGGITSNANVTKVNLVFVLEDGMKVNIPNNSDLKDNPYFEYITLNSGDGKNNDYLSNDLHTESKNSKSSKNYEVVNINTATQTELETLPRNWTISSS